MIGIQNRSIINAGICFRPVPTFSSHGDAGKGKMLKLKFHFLAILLWYKDFKRNINNESFAPKSPAGGRIAPFFYKRPWEFWRVLLAMLINLNSIAFIQGKNVFSGYRNTPIVMFEQFDPLLWPKQESCHLFTRLFAHGTKTYDLTNVEYGVTWNTKANEFSGQRHQARC